MSRDLGRLERVELRDIWSSESTDFTPWLARQENLEVLADTLGIELELEAQEQRVGPFRADLLCKDLGSDRWVLIENQLERTDHTHLGQLLTYASGLEAVTIVWIAARFTEEHRATLDWLNRITDDTFLFFGLEVELWRIGSSPAAPKFNLVSKPNDWAQSVAQAARAIDETELSETRIAQRTYWTAFQNVLQVASGPVSGNRKPQAYPWMAYPIGRAGFHLGAATNRPKKNIRVELYLSGDRAKVMLALLQRDRSEIEGELGYIVDWEELPRKRDSRVSLKLEADPADEADWSRQHQWLAQHLNNFHNVFARRVADLNDDTDSE